MANEEKQIAETPVAEKEVIQELSLEQSAAGLVKYGGFGIVETTIDGAENMNPGKKARKKIFLTEDAKKQERESLKKRLALILDLLSSSESVATLIGNAQEKSDNARMLLNKNLKTALDATRDLERSYRSVNNFYKNTDQDKAKGVFLMNAAMDQLADLDNTVFFDAISEEFNRNYDRLDLRENYSILALPGYLGSKKVVEKWARMANNNKVMLITDFEHLDAPEDVIDLFESADMAGSDIHFSNVMMTCNWVVGRGRNQDVGEEEDLYVPPSTALAGKVYSTLMSQVAAGKKHGGLNEIDGVRFGLKKAEISSLEKLGLIPMVNEYGKVMAFSAKTLFNGDNLGLQTYSVVRVFDYVTKVLIDFLNRRAFENWNAKTERDLRGQIIKFLDSITGPDKLIEKFKITRFERDPVQKDKIYLDIHMTPYFPAKSFLIKMDGHKGDDVDAAEWDTKYDKA